MGRLRVRSLFVPKPPDESAQGPDASAKEPAPSHPPASAGPADPPANGSTATPAAADARPGFLSSTSRAIASSGVLRRIRRTSVRHSLPQSAVVPAPDQHPASSSSHKSIDFESSSSSTTPSVGITGLPELDPVLRFLQNQSNKLYREGYLLQLNDLNLDGHPCVKRDWTPYFARLCGTVLSFWPANDGDSVQTSSPPALYMNIADATLKILDSLPTDGPNAPLENILSISTAGRNRYLFHFSSPNTLTQWTAAIRLAIFEYALLQESYTGALIAGKGKYVNGLRHILAAPTKFNHGEWVRVRFRPGTAWVRCWCVIEPPSERETAKLRKTFKKQQRESIYDRSSADKPRANGSVLLYADEKVSKKAPIASITDAWMAYALYPRGIELIDHSTLIKVHGMIQAPSPSDDASSSTKKKSKKKDDTVQVVAEGAVFILPESRPAVAGYDVLLRFLIPLYDAFSLYGRPTRLIADTSNTRSLMFAVDCNRVATDQSGRATSRGYLDLPDVTPLILTRGSQSWTEQDWMRNLKNLTAKKVSLETPYRSISNTVKANASAAAQPAVSFPEHEPSPRIASKMPGAIHVRRKAAPQSAFRSISESSGSPGTSGAHGYAYKGSAQNGYVGNLASTVELESPAQPARDHSSRAVDHLAVNHQLTSDGPTDSVTYANGSVDRSDGSSAMAANLPERDAASLRSARQPQEYFSAPLADSARPQTPSGSNPPSLETDAHSASGPDADKNTRTASHIRERASHDQHSERSAHVASAPPYGEEEDSGAVLVPDDDATAAEQSPFDDSCQSRTIANGSFSTGDGNGRGGEVDADGVLLSTDHHKQSVISTRILPYEQSPVS